MPPSRCSNRAAFRRCAARRPPRCRTSAIAATRAACIATSTPVPRRTEMMDADTLALIPQVLAARARSARSTSPAAPRAASGLPCAGAGGAGARRARDRPLQPHHPVRARAGGSRRSSSPSIGVEVVASLPCYSADNVDRQRGKGVFEAQHRRPAAPQRSVTPGRQRRVLNLVYNPQGRCCRRPGPARADYRRELAAQFGIVFNPPVRARQHADPALRLDMLISKGSSTPTWRC